MAKKLPHKTDLLPINRVIRWVISCTQARYYIADQPRMAPIGILHIRLARRNSSVLFIVTVIVYPFNFDRVRRLVHKFDLHKPLGPYGLQILSNCRNLSGVTSGQPTIPLEIRQHGFQTCV
jgi:hypothetical protein